MMVIRNENDQYETGEEGFILVITMLILVVLSIIGISATNLTEMELKIAGNERVHNETFYQADSGTEVGLRLAYDNAICSRTSGGFSATSGYGGSTLIGDHVIVDNLKFTESSTAPDPNDTNRHIVYYPHLDLSTISAVTYLADKTDYDKQPNTNITVGAVSDHVSGSGLQMVSGYEGLGSSSIGGGTRKTYTIKAKHDGGLGSESLVTLQWQLSTHILNSASSQDCNY